METVLRDADGARLIHFSSDYYNSRPKPVLLHAWDACLAHLVAPRDKNGASQGKAAVDAWAKEHPLAAGIVSVQPEPDCIEPRFFGVAGGKVTRPIRPSTLTQTGRGWTTADYHRGYLAGYEAGVRRVAKVLRDTVNGAVTTAVEDAVTEGRAEAIERLAREEVTHDHGPASLP